MTERLTRSGYLALYFFTFWGAALGGIPLGSFSLFPARLLTLGIWLLVAVQLNRYVMAWRQVPKATVFLVFWLFWAVCALLWVAETGPALRDLGNLFMGLSLVALAPIFLRNQEDKAAKIWMAVFFIFLALALVEHITGLHLPISRFSRGAQPHLAYRPTAAFVNENNFAVFINLSIPFLLAHWRHYPAHRWGVGLGLAAGIFLLLVTGSRINYAVLLLALVIYSCFLTPRGKRLRVLAALLALVLVVGLIFALTQPLRGQYMADQLEEGATALLDLLNPQGGGYSSNSLALRLAMLRRGGEMLQATRGLGVGPGNFETWVAATPSAVVNPHNWWLELASEYGILVFLAYLTCYGSLTLGIWCRWRHQGHWLSEALALSLAIFPWAALAPSTLLAYAPHWSLLALALAWWVGGKEESCAS